ncbi:MAG: ABC transporter permease [Xanthomonadales bacterium]|nr:ABC transporter permease [Xanthomonadales bacterium]
MQLFTQLTDIVADSWRAIRSRLRLHLLISGVLATGLIVLCVMSSFLTALYGGPPPAIDAERLHAIAKGAIGVSQPNAILGTDLVELRQRDPALSEVVAYQWVEANLGGNGSARMVDALSVDGDLFGTLGWAVEHGRNFTSSDFAPAAPATAIISERLWRTQFAGSAAVIGSSIRLDGEAVTVIGVLAPELTFPFQQQVYRAVDLTTQGEALKSSWSAIVSVADPAERETISAVVDNFQRERVAQLGEEAEREPIRLAHYWQNTTGPEVQVMAWVLGILVALLLILASTNAGGLMLVLWMSRARDLATRKALGQGVLRSVATVYCQALTVAVAGLLIALPVSRWLLDRLEQWLHESENGMPLFVHMPLANEVLVWAAAGTFLCAAVLALPTVRRLRSNQIIDQLREGERGNSVGIGRFSRSLFALQCGLATLTVLVALVCAEGARRELDRPLGLNSSDVVTANFRADGEQLAPYAAALQRRASELPGVSAVSVAGAAPIAWTPERELQIGEQKISADFFPADEYFDEVWGLRLLSGYWFSGEDVLSRNPVVVIDRTLAEQAFAGDALGRTLQVADRRIGDQLLTVVGVIDSVRLTSRGGVDRPSLFTPVRTDAGYTLTLSVRSEGPAQNLIKPLQQLALSVNPDIALMDLQTFERMRWSAADWTRLVLSLFAPMALIAALLALIAALLAATALAGLLGFLVTQRRWEIGLRRALGANHQGILSTLLRGLRMPALIGISLGLGAAMLLAVPLGQSLYGEADQSGSAAIGTLLVLGLSLLLAALMPLRRALRVQPAQVLRGD